MEKLYKRIVFFVGLIALNMTVYAQLDGYSLYFSVGSSSTAKSVLIHPFFTNSISDGKDWAGVAHYYTAKEVTNFTNYPNPAITETTVSYTLSVKAKVNLRVIDLAGRQLKVLVNQEQAAGKQDYFWEFSKNKITSGMYILILQVDNKILSRKMIVQ